MDDLLSVSWMMVMSATIVLVTFYVALLTIIKFAKGRVKSYLHLVLDSFLYFGLIFNLGNLVHILLEGDANKSGLLASISILAATIPVVVYRYIKSENKAVIRLIITKPRMGYKAVISIWHLSRILVKNNILNMYAAVRISMYAFQESYKIHSDMSDLEEFRIDKIGSLVFITDMLYQIRGYFKVEDKISGVCTKEIHNIKVDISDEFDAKYFYKIGYLDRSIISEVIKNYEQTFPIIKTV